ncbi:PAS domain S-box protein [Saccharospirillum impatiens]|uniref:PAS domain S-box protein n=1 Tax=Saccharospirillum impatiens TaxID=169438 RepID=UPI000423D1FD|nr:PAS domain S-box protein [Saccharospirillum impatiens]
MDELWNYMFSSNLMPHGMCYLWRPDMLVLHAGSDTIIALSYFSIPLALAQYWKKREGTEFGWVLKLFAAFILACGTTHLFSIWNIWNGDYYAQGLVKLITAGVSLATAIVIWPLIPRLVSIPSPVMLAERNEALHREVDLRISAENRLRDFYASLEQAVADRTEELQKAKDALERQIRSSDRVKQRLQSIFESAPNGMIVVNRDGLIQQANSTAHAIFNYPLGSLEGRPIESLVPEKQRVQHQQDRNGYVASPAKRMMGDRKDLRGLRLDGSMVPIEIGLNPVTGSEAGDVVASVVDVSQRKAYEQKIEQRNTALERSNQELKEFAFIASHDLREPLRKVISFSALRSFLWKSSIIRT